MSNGKKRDQQNPTKMWSEEILAAFHVRVRITELEQPTKAEPILVAKCLEFINQVVWVDELLVTLSTWMPHRAFYAKGACQCGDKKNCPGPCYGVFGYSTERTANNYIPPEARRPLMRFEEFKG